MKKLFLLIVLALVASVWLGGLMLQDPGYVLFSYRNTTLETSLWIGILLVVSLVLVSYVTVRLLLGLLGSGAMVRGWWSNRGRRRSVAKTTHGMIDLVEGNWAAAQKKLSQAADKSDTPLLNYLGAARAAAENEDSQATEELLAAARDSEPGAELAVAIAKAEIQIHRSQYEQALATLLQKVKQYPRHKQLHRLLQQVYLELQDWQALGRLLPVLRKLKVAPLAELDEIEQKTVLMSMQRVMSEAPEKSGTEGRLEKLREIWTQTQAKVRRREYLTLKYTENLRALGAPQWAVPALFDSIRQQWSDRLVELYGVIKGPDIQDQLKNAESWMKTHSNSAVLMLALGRLSMRNKLWGKAREYYMASVKINKTPVACAELGRLLKHLGEDKASQEQVRQGIELLTGELPDLPMPEPRPAGVTQLVGS